MTLALKGSVKRLALSLVALSALGGCAVYAPPGPYPYTGTVTSASTLYMDAATPTPVYSAPIYSTPYYYSPYYYGPPAYVGPPISLNLGLGYWSGGGRGGYRGGRGYWGGRGRR
jgi:hypothetical protein